MSAHNFRHQEQKATRYLYTTKTASATLTTTELKNSKVIIANKASVLTLTFPAASNELDGMVRYVINMGAGALTVAFTAASGATTRLLAQDESLVVICDGSYWYGESDTAVTAVTSTTAAAFEVDFDGTVPALALGSQALGTGNFTQTLKPPATLSANQDILFQNAAGTVCYTSGTPDQTFTVDSDTTHTNITLSAAASGGSTKTLTLIPHATFAADYVVTFPDPGGADEVVYTDLVQTLVGKELTTPTISSTGFTNAQHDHSGSTSGGSIAASAAGTGTTSTTFTLDPGTSNGALALQIVGGGSPHTVTIRNTITTADRTLTLPNATGTFVLKDTTDVLTSKTLTAPVINGTVTTTGLVMPAWTAGGAIDFSDEAMTNVDINSGAIDGTAIGAASASTGAFTSIAASLDVTLAAGKDVILAQGDGEIKINAASTGSIIIKPRAATTSATTIDTIPQTQTTTISFPDVNAATDTIATLGVANAFAGINTFASITGNDAHLNITGTAGSSGAGGTVITAGGAGDTNTAGGLASYTGGAGNGTGAGGAASLVGGASGAGAAGNGGAITVTGGAGSGTSTSDGGAVTIASGASTGGSGTAGALSIDTGNKTGGTAGGMTIAGTYTEALGIGSAICTTSITGNVSIAAGDNLTMTEASGNGHIVMNGGTAGTLKIVPVATPGGAHETKLTTGTGQTGDAVITLPVITSTLAGLGLDNAFTGACTFAGIVGNDPSLGITGKAGSTSVGYPVVIAGGLGSGVDNDGGLVSSTGGGGGVGTATTGGDGGATTNTGGVGGTATTGVGGAGGVASVISGAGGEATGDTSTGGASGAVTIASGVGGVADHASVSTAGAGGLLSITGGDGGAAGDSLATGGAGATVAITAGTGGVSGGTDGDGGDVTIVAGAGDAAGDITIGGTNSVTTTIGIADAGTVQLQSLNLILDSEDPMVFQIGTVDVLEIDDNAIDMTGGATAIGHACYIGTEGGGTADGATGKAGGLLNITTGAGSTGTTTAGAGGALALATGIGATTATGGGGVSGVITVTSGVGGAATGAAAAHASGAVTVASGTGGLSSTSGTGGAAGLVTIGGGTGGAGNGGGGTGDGGAGAAVTVSGGTGGASGSTGGAGGAITVDAGAGVNSGANGVINIGTTTSSTTTLGRVGAATAVTASSLTLNSVAEFNLQINSVNAIAIDDEAIAGNAGASGATGTAVYVETQDGGAAAATAGNAGGLFNLKTGDGSTGTVTPGAGGAITIASGDAASTATGTGALSGAISIATGKGGEATGAAVGGASAGVTIATGTGGVSGTSAVGGAAGLLYLHGGSGGTAVGDDGGAGGAITLLGGTGGVSSGTDGTGGAISIDAGDGADVNGSINIGITNSLLTTIGIADAGTVQLQSAALILDSEDPMMFQIGTVDILALDDTTIVAAGAATVAGKACYVGTETGGTKSGDAGVAGGLLNITTGAGSDGASAGVGGAGGALALATGIGGTTATGAGGLSGAITVTSGIGGISTGASAGHASGPVTISSGVGGASQTSGAGGAAGTVTIQGGAGGVDEATGDPGGVGGAIDIHGGAGGAGASATEGVGGAVSIDGGSSAVTNGAINIGATNTEAIAIGRTAATTTLKGAVKAEEAEGYIVHGAVVDATLTEIKATGHVLITVPAGRSFQLIDLYQVSIGGACATATTVDVVGSATLVATAVGTLTENTLVSLTTGGVTTLAAGASFAAQTAGVDITVEDTGGGALEGCSSIRFIFTYMLI